MRGSTRVAIALGIVMLAFGQMRAETVVVNIAGTDGETTWTDEIRIPVDPDGTFFWTGSSTTEAWNADLLLTGDVDPVVVANFSAQNLLGLPITFTVNTFLPVAPPIGVPTLTSGSVAYTTTDGSLPQNGSTVATLPGSSLYRALIDGVSFMTLFDAPYSLVAAPGGSASDNTDFGLPGQTMPGPPISTSMEITYHFSLTPNDLVSITGNFVALPIPEPSSIVLCGLGLVAAALLARRARS